MPDRIIAFDLGSNSIGAAIRNPYENEQLAKTIVTTFETGVGKDSTSGQYTVSLAANRTSKRSVRRLYQSRKYKLWALLATLIQDSDKLYCPISSESLARWKYYNKDLSQEGKGGRKYPIDDIAFNNWIKLDFNNDGIPDYKSPYQLRHELATVLLDFSKQEDRFKLGRALYHIAQHRGFKSSKVIKNKSDDQENLEMSVAMEAETAIGAEKKRQERFYNEVAKLGFEIRPEEDTVGSIFALIENEGIHHEVRKVEGIRIRRELHQFVTRKMLIKEVKDIFEFQNIKFTSIFKDLRGKPTNYQNSVIFRQRPLRSQKRLVGICSLENKQWHSKDSNGNYKIRYVGKRRCPISRPEFEEFRALGLINNIAVKVKNDKHGSWEFLPIDKRKELYEGKFFVLKDFSFESIYKFKPLSIWLDNRYGKDNWELNYRNTTKVQSCVVSARLKKLLGEEWNKMASKQKRGVDVKILHSDKNGGVISSDILMQPTFEDVWHVLQESSDEDFIVQYAQVMGLNEDELVNLWYDMPVGYSQISLKAIKRILPFLRDGFNYTDAVLLAKVPDILGFNNWLESKNRIIEELRSKVISKNRYEKRILSIVNDLIAQDKVNGKRELNFVVGSLDAQLPEGSIERDSVRIQTAIMEGLGKGSWNDISKDERDQIIADVTHYYQRYYNTLDRKFYSLPPLTKAMKEYIFDEFESLFGEGASKIQFLKRLEQLYHPSMMEIYPKAKKEYYRHGELEKQMVLLGSPKIGSWKNPMALRALNELKKLVNYLIATEEIDMDTRVVVEIARELVDTNKRWAYEKYKQIREEENIEFAKCITEFLKSGEINANPGSDADIDKFRLWYEMLESKDGYEKNRNFKCVDEDRIYTNDDSAYSQSIRNNSFEENYFDKIRKEVWFKLKKSKNNIEERYKLWKEQKCFCIYTGKIIRISDLFDTNLIDVEHTIPRSISFDNSLANKTVCFADYNRNVKRNRIPAELGDDYAAIRARINKWEEKVEDLKIRVSFWKDKSKYASTKDYKDTCIRQMHLWQFELDYWRNKVERFTMKEVKSGFKNSQLKDTQIISKYAFHYLKSYFNKVEVQKGEVTSDFGKIFGIQSLGAPKDRTKHTHHAKDAIILSMIPGAAIRDRILEVWYEIDENRKLLTSNVGNKDVIIRKIDGLNDELFRLKLKCKVPQKVNELLKKVDDTLIVNNIMRNRSFLPSKRVIKINGNKKYATGDSVRGKLHSDTFYGAIKLVKKLKNGKWERDTNGQFIFEPIKYVIREELRHKENSKSPGFKDLNDLEGKIVDKNLFGMIKLQVEEFAKANDISGNIYKEAVKNGIWMLDKHGNRVNKIRRVRIYASVKFPNEIKQHIYISNKPSNILPDRNHKKVYYAENGENIICAVYQKLIKSKNGKSDKIQRSLDIISLMNAAELLKLGLIKRGEGFENILYEKDNYGNVIIDENGNKSSPYALLKTGMKVIFYDKSIDELMKQIDESEVTYYKRLSYRTYKIVKFSGGQITFRHHLDARSEKDLENAYPETNVYKVDNNQNEVKYGKKGINGFTEHVSDALKFNSYNNFEPWPKLLYTKNWLNMAIEDKHFVIEPDGTIKLIILKEI